MREGFFEPQAEQTRRTLASHKSLVPTLQASRFNTRKNVFIIFHMLSMVGAEKQRTREGNNIDYDDNNIDNNKERNNNINDDDNNFDNNRVIIILMTMIIMLITTTTKIIMKLEIA